MRTKRKSPPRKSTGAADGLNAAGGPENAFDVHSQMEFILRATETRLDLLDSDFNVIYVDPIWADVYGDPTGRKCYEYLMGRSEICPNCGAKKALETRRPTTTEQTLAREGNRVVQVTSIPFQDENGRWFVAEANIDITELRELQEGREESERAYRLLAENATDVICMWDLDLNPLWVSPSAEGHTGYTAEEWKRIPVDKTMTPESVERAMAAFSRAKQSFEEGQGFPDSFEMEGEVYRKDGTTFWAENRYRLIRDSQGNPAAIVMQSRDITDRKKIEDALRATEARFHSIIEHASDNIWALGPDLRLVFQSPAAERMLGYTMTEWATMTWRDFVHPDDLDTITNIVKRFIQDPNEGSITATVRMITRDGTEKWIDVAASPVRHNDGTLSGLVGISRDITDRKRLEEALRTSEARFRSIIEHASDNIWALGPDLRITYQSPSTERILGYALPEWADMTWRDFVHPDDLDTLVNVVNGFRRDPTTGSITANVRMIAKDGTEKWVEIAASPVRQDDGKLVGVVGVSRDVTERTLVEQALRDSEERFRLIADNTSDGIWALGPDLRITYQSPATERIFGYTLPDWATITWRDFVHPDDLDTIMSIIMSFRQERDTGSVTTTVRIHDKDGQEKWVDISASPIRGEDGRLDGIVGVTRDVTERRLVEQALRSSEERLRRLFQTMAEGVLLIAPDGRIVEANPAAVHILGLTRREITDRSFVSPEWRVLRPDGTPMPMEETAALRAMNGKRPIRETLMGIEQPGGAIVWLNVSASPLLSGNGDLDGVVCTFADVTERRRAFQVVRESEEKYRTLVESIPQKVFLKDKDSVYISCNSSYAADLGIDPEKIAGRTDYDLYPRQLADNYRADDRRVFESGTIQRIEERYLEHGEERIVETFKAPVRDESGRVVGLLGIFHDITERKQAELRQRDREIAETRAEEVRRSRQRLISTQELLRKDIASQLHGTVQNRLILLAHRLADLEARPASERTAGELADIRRRLEELQTDHIRPISHRLFPSVLRLGIAAGLESLVDEYSGNLPVDLQISRRLRESEQVDRRLIPDDAKLALYRIAEEALANILKHAPAAQETVVRLSLSDAGILRLTVRDHGAGFAIAQPSTGIGLAIASDYAAAAGGSCIVKSAPGKGTRVTARIPLAEPQSRQRPKGRLSG